MTNTEYRECPQPENLCTPSSNHERTPKKYTTIKCTEISATETSYALHIFRNEVG